MHRLRDIIPPLGPHSEHKVLGFFLPDHLTPKHTFLAIYVQMVDIKC